MLINRNRSGHLVIADLDRAPVLNLIDKGDRAMSLKWRRVR
jgi:hypothetical protein